MTVPKIDLSDIETEYESDNELPLSSIASALVDNIARDTMTIPNIDLSDIETNYGSDSELPLSSIERALVKKEVETSEYFDYPPGSNINIEDESQTSLTSDKDQNNLVKRYECDICRKIFFKRSLVIEHFQTSLCFPESPSNSKNVSSKYNSTNNTNNNIENSILDTNTTDNSLMNNSKKTFKFKTGKKVRIKIEKNKFLKKILKKMRIYEYSHCAKRKWKCLICRKSFTKLSILKTHRSIHTNQMQLDKDNSFYYSKDLEKQKTFSCPTCHELFTELSLYLAHKKNHYLKKIDPCNVDQIHSNVKSNISKNVNKKNYISQKYECSRCSKVFHRRYTIIRHIFNKHPEDYSKYSCDTCLEESNDFTGEIILRIQKNVVKCDVCPQSFITSHKLNQHYKWHIGDNNFRCQYCKITFSQYSVYLSHEKTHVGGKPFLCHFCGKWFPVSSNLNIYLVHHKPFVDNDSLESSLKLPPFVSLKKQSKNKNGKKSYCMSTTFEKNVSCSRYKCNLCNKSFTYLNTLKLHLKTHKKTKRSNSSKETITKS